MAAAKNQLTKKQARWYDALEKIPVKDLEGMYARARAALKEAYRSVNREREMCKYLAEFLETKGVVITDGEDAQTDIEAQIEKAVQAHSK